MTASHMTSLTQIAAPVAGVPACVSSPNSYFFGYWFSHWRA
ncbi:hypothetical protein [Isoalcanivorax pacificus]|nr:hypothetical protein [Isoalcanivorax pacificus]